MVRLFISGESWYERTAQILGLQPGAPQRPRQQHGTGDDGENDRWLEKMDARAQRLRLEGGFHRVRVATLREDWPEKREPSAAAVRAFVEEASSGGRTALVIPFRVFGFGPYAETLEGLDYRSDGRGLIPHPAVAQWIDEQVLKLRDEADAR